jgi:hypothetical protein
LATASEPIFHLVYISQTSEELGYNDIDEILSEAKVHNPAQKITGVLIHSDGYFVQLLEGPNEKVVKQALGRIIVDERHNNLRVVGEWFSAARLFPKTAMGFCDSDMHRHASCFSYIQKLFSNASPFNFAQPRDLIDFFNEFSLSEIELK